MTAQPSSLTMNRVLEAVLAATVVAQYARRPVPTEAPMPAAEVDGEWAVVLRENLRAASQHVALGHESTSFRDCSHPRCLDAANLIPILETVDEGATDAELDGILDRVQTALDAGAFGEAPTDGQPALPVR